MLSDLNDLRECSRAPALSLLAPVAKYVVCAAADCKRLLLQLTVLCMQLPIARVRFVAVSATIPNIQVKLCSSCLQMAFVECLKRKAQHAGCAVDVKQMLI